MLRRGDERAVSVQIGAVLLLAIFVSALALFQVNGVPAENQDVEYSHSESVQNDLQDLRNAIQNVGSSGGTQPTSVTLGTQYPSRTFLTNPPAPRGRLETTETGTVRIENARVDTSAQYEGDPNRLLETTYETTTLVYEPGYNEYRNAPTTRIEHGYAFNDFGETTVPLTDQKVISDGTVKLVLLDGQLSESGSGAVSLDPEILSGPTDEVPITADGPDNITVTIPTRAPERWNETLGITFDAGEPDARVVGYEDGELRIKLADRSGGYTLQMARVGIGESGERSDDFDVRRADNAGGSSGSPAYFVDWQDPSGQSSVDDDRCDAASCVVVGETVDLTMATNGTADGATVEYAVSDQSIGSVSPNEGTTDSNGRDTTTFTVDPNAEDGETVTVYTSSGSDGDRIQLEISHGRSPPTASLDAATYTSTDRWWWQIYEVTVDWSATDDDELSGGSVNEVRLYDSAGELFETREITPTGTADNGRVTFDTRFSDPSEWTAEIVVSNSNGMRDSDSATVTND